MSWVQKMPRKRSNENETHKILRRNWAAIFICVGERGFNFEWDSSVRQPLQLLIAILWTGIERVGRRLCALANARE